MRIGQEMRKVGLEEGVEAPVGPEQQATREIPRSQFTRIRALVKTVSQVAEVYKVAAGDIERILRQA